MRLRFVLPLAVLVVSAGAPGTAAASPGKGQPTAAVALGDSYISGEAGRWQGNSTSPAPGNDGTDRACTGGPPCSVDKSKVYVGGTDTNACHRSDVAEILTAALPVTKRFNLSCSGGVTKNIFRAASGGEGQGGEQPQADQLLPVVMANDVKLVQLSIGGNDLGFASIVQACLTAYANKAAPPCSESQQPVLDSKKAKATADVMKAIDEIRAVMTQAGYAATDYRLVAQTYPSVVPRASESRYTENDPIRANVCPFRDVDLTWGRDSASKQIGEVVKAAATAKGVEVLDLADAFQGHEFCAKTTRLADALTPPSPTTSEWGRFLGASVVQQGELQETFHPNAYGQAAFASCVGQAFAKPAGTFKCTTAPGAAPSAMTLTQTAVFGSGSGSGSGTGAGSGGTGTGSGGTTTPGGTTPGGTTPGTGTPGGTTPGSAAAPKRLGLGILRTSRRSGKTCVTFSVRAAGKAVAGASVRLAGRHGKTAGNGRVVLCHRFATGKATASAKRAGYKTSSVRTVRPRSNKS